MCTTNPRLLIPAKRKLWFKVEPKRGAKKLKRQGSGAANKDYELDFRECNRISAALSERTDTTEARVLIANRKPKKCFEGMQPGHKGFRLGSKETFEILKDDRENAAVIYPYLNGTALLTEKWRKTPEFIIDFERRDMLQASEFTRPMGIVRERVLPKWETNAKNEKKESGKESGEHQRRVQTWWQLKRGRRDFVRTVQMLNRYIACSRVTKRPIFCFVAHAFRPDSSLTAFAFNDDYSFGILQSNTHWQWFVAKCSKLKSDFRYTPESVFDTFPWPQSPAAKLVTAVAEAGREVRRVRDEALKKVKGGLRAVYRTLELPGKNPLKDAHAELDAAALEAYGFSAKKDLLAQLLELNLAVAAAIDRGEPVTAPGIPAAFLSPKALVTDDCIRPS